MIVCDSCSTGRVPLSVTQAAGAGDAASASLTSLMSPPLLGADEVFNMDAVGGDSKDSKAENGANVRVCCVCFPRLSHTTSSTIDLTWM